MQASVWSEYCWLHLWPSPVIRCSALHYTVLSSSASFRFQGGSTSVTEEDGEGVWTKILVSDFGFWEMIRATAPTQDFQEPIRAIKAPWVIFELADMLACTFSALSNFFLPLKDPFILIDLNFLLLKTIHIPPDYCMFSAPGPIGPHPKAHSLSQARWPDTRQAGVPVGGLTLVQTESRQLTVNTALEWEKEPRALGGCTSRWQAM